MRTIEPLGNNVLVEAVKPPEKIGRFYVPEPSRHQEGEGTVVAVGPGRVAASGAYCSMGIKPGDHVVYNWVNGREVKLDGKTYKLLDAEEILGVIRAEVPEKYICPACAIEFPVSAMLKFNNIFLCATCYTEKIQPTHDGTVDVFCSEASAKEMAQQKE